MALQLSVTYEQLIELIGQLSEAQQKALITYLLRQQSERRPLTTEERLALLEAVQLDVSVNEAPSIRRVDWYDDDGR